MIGKKTQGASSIRKCLAIMDAFTVDSPQRTLSEIAQILDVPLPTASRIAAALCEEGFLEKVEGRAYQLGWKCYRMGAVFEATNSISTRAYPYMHRLWEAYNETVSLYLRRGIVRLCCEEIPSTHRLKRVTTPGDVYPLWAGAATGKCFLAFMDAREIQAVKDAMPEVLPEENQLPWEKLIEEAYAVRNNGYATSVSEREPNITSIACPVFNFTGLPVACINISGPSFRFTDELVPKIIVSILQETRELSLSLGAPRAMLNFPEPKEFPHLQGN